MGQSAYLSFCHSLVGSRIACVLILAVSALASCAPSQVSLAPSLSLTDLSGDTRIGIAPGARSADLESAGANDAELSVGFEAMAKWESRRLSIESAWFDYAGDGLLTAALGSGGSLLPVGSAVDTDVSLAAHRALFFFEFLPHDRIQVGVGGGLMYCDYASSFSSGIQRVSYEQQTLVPVVSAEAMIRVLGADVAARFAGSDFAVDAVDVAYSQIDLIVRREIWGREQGARIGWLLQYRLLDWRHDSSATDSESDVSISGFGAGISVSN